MVTVLWVILILVPHKVTAPGKVLAMHLNKLCVCMEPREKYFISGSRPWKEEKKAKGIINEGGKAISERHISRFGSKKSLPLGVESEGIWFSNFRDSGAWASHSCGPCLKYITSLNLLYIICETWWRLANYVYICLP